MGDDSIALFAFEDTPDGPKMTMERHFTLVPHDRIAAEDLARYQQSLLAEQ